MEYFDWRGHEFNQNRQVVAPAKVKKLMNITIVYACDGVNYMEKYVNNEIIFIVEESPEGGYEARSLNYSIFTEADSFEELKEMIHDAVSCHFEPEARPRVIRLHQVKEELMAV